MRGGKTMFQNHPNYIGPDTGLLEVGRRVDWISKRGKTLDELRELYEAAGRVFALPPLEALENPEPLRTYLKNGWLKFDEPFCGPAVEIADGYMIRRAHDTMRNERVLYRTRTLRTYTEGGREVSVTHFVPIENDEASSYYELSIVFNTGLRGPSVRAVADLMREYPSSDVDHGLEIYYAEA
jgi:hypothetical protein